MGAFALTAAAAVPALAAEKLPASREDVARQDGNGVFPQRVTKRGCIARPGQKVSYRFRAGFPNNFYSARPTNRDFDVVMRVALQGFRAVTVDRYFAPGTERYNFRSPTRNRPVAVTISGFRGSTGCFVFDARP